MHAFVNREIETYLIAENDISLCLYELMTIWTFQEMATLVTVSAFHKTAWLIFNISKELLFEFNVRGN